jgi:hypothetical protein
MTVVVFLMTDGKTLSDHPILHLLIGASLGLLVGFFVSRKMKVN